MSKKKKARMTPKTMVERNKPDFCLYCESFDDVLSSQSRCPPSRYKDIKADTHACVYGRLKEQYRKKKNDKAKT